MRRQGAIDRGLAEPITKRKAETRGEGDETYPQNSLLAFASQPLAFFLLLLLLLFSFRSVSVSVSLSRSY